ncbi:MAG TPA: hypothetical protein VH985_08780 [Candidatus Binatia bacterium]|jgi:hypothetical protein
MSKSSSFKIILLLALVQGVAGMLRGFNWVRLGGNLFGQGLLLLPMIGAVAVMRGLFISGVALLYVLFVIGALLEKSWVWWPCVSAAIINLLLVLSAVAQGASLAEAIAWSVIPVILLFYFFSQKSTDAQKSA